MIGDQSWSEESTLIEIEYGYLHLFKHNTLSVSNKVMIGTNNTSGHFFTETVRLKNIN